MIAMTPEELADAGRQMWGDTWTTAMARWLPCSARNVRRWHAGQRKIPPDIAKRLRTELERAARAPALVELERLGATGARVTLPEPQTDDGAEIVTAVANFLAGLGFRVSGRAA